MCCCDCLRAYLGLILPGRELFLQPCILGLKSSDVRCRL